MTRQSRIQDNLKLAGALGKTPYSLVTEDHRQRDDLTFFGTAFLLF